MTQSLNSRLAQRVNSVFSSEKISHTPSLTCLDDGEPAGVYLHAHGVGGPAGECSVIPRRPGDRKQA